MAARKRKSRSGREHKKHFKVVTKAYKMKRFIPFTKDIALHFLKIFFFGVPLIKLLGVFVDLQITLRTKTFFSQAM